MSPRILSASVVCLWLFAVVPASFAADFAWVPQGATGTHNIVGQEIILTGAGQEVTLDLEMSGWDPEQDGNPLLAAFSGHSGFERLHHRHRYGAESARLARLTTVGCFSDPDALQRQLYGGPQRRTLRGSGGLSRRGLHRELRLCVPRDAASPRDFYSVN